MDEMSMVRRLLAEPPPPPDVVAAGREQLRDGAVGKTRKAGGLSVRRGPALVITGIAAAAVLMATILIPGAGRSPNGIGSSVTYTSARSVLFAAAGQAESVRSTGAYWHVRTMSTVTLPDRFGRKGRRYTLQELTTTERWTDRSGRAWIATREWVRPRTAQDEVAWRQDGAPRQWCSGKTDTDPPKPICLRTAPGISSLTRDYFPFEVGEGHELTFGQLQRLPTSAGALRTSLLATTRHDLDRSASDEIVDSNVAQILANLLVYPPVPPGVRAAAYRALAEMPNVVSAGPTRDELGRSGIGIKISEGRGWVLVPGASGSLTCAGERTHQRDQCAGEETKLTRTLIIDPATSHVLADETRIGNRAEPALDRVILAVGWTNEKPSTPSG